MSTRYGIPCIKLPNGEYIQPGRIVRFLAGIPALITTVVTALKAVRNGKK